MLIIAALYGVLLGTVYFTQDSLVYFPNVAREHVATPAARGLRFDDLRIRTEDGEQLHAWWIPAEGETRGAALVLHGNAGNISHRLDYAQMFHSMGYGTLLVDYRGYGRSTGKPTEVGTYRDAQAGWRWLREEKGLAEEQIVVFGESLGGAVACWLAARQRPQALILASTFTSINDLGGELYRFLPVRLISRFGYDTRECLGRVQVPVMIAHSPDDDIVPFAHGERLYQAAREPKTFLRLSGSHNEGLVHRKWASAVREFLMRSGAR